MSRIEELQQAYGMVKTEDIILDSIKLLTIEYENLDSPSQLSRFSQISILQDVLYKIRKEVKSILERNNYHKS